MKKYDLPAMYTRRDRPRLNPSFIERHPIIMAPFVLFAGLLLIPCFAYERVKEKLFPSLSKGRFCFTPMVEAAEREHIESAWEALVMNGFSTCVTVSYIFQ